MIAERYFAKARPSYYIILRKNICFYLNIPKKKFKFRIVNEAKTKKNDVLRGD